MHLCTHNNFSFFVINSSRSGYDQLPLIPSTKNANGSPEPIKILLDTLQIMCSKQLAAAAAEIQSVEKALTMSAENVRQVCRYEMCPAHKIIIDSSSLYLYISWIPSSVLMT